MQRFHQSILYSQCWQILVIFIYLIKSESHFLELPWLWKLRIHCCHCCGSGYSCGVDLILGLGTSDAVGMAKKPFLGQKGFFLFLFLFFFSFNGLTIYSFNFSYWSSKIFIDFLRMLFFGLFYYFKNHNHPRRQSQKILLRPVSKSLLPMFSSRIFMI